MTWDLGLQGLGVLALMSIAFGIIAVPIVGLHPRLWVWLIATAAYFVTGLFISEVWFGWATEEELQPNIDGLSFDEVLLIGLIPGVAAVLVTRRVTRRRRQRAEDLVSGR